MRVSMTNSKASNWVDRGEPPIPVMQRVLNFFFNRHAPADQDWQKAAAEDVLGMVAADATAFQIAGYLKHVARQQSLEFPPKTRLTSIALWHIGKAGLVRDTATRLLNSDGVRDSGEPPKLSQWLALRLLSKEEMERFGNEGQALTDEE